MEFKKCLQGRRSVRKFKPEAVSEAVLKNLVQTASFAPSWKNSQTVRYVAIADDAIKAELANNCVLGFAPNQQTILNSPVLILVTTVSPRSGFERDGTPSTSKGTHWESLDAGIAVQTFCLAAYEEGLGTAVLGIYDEDKVIKAARIPEGQKVSAMIALGYPDEEPAMPKRRDTEELLTII